MFSIPYHPFLPCSIILYHIPLPYPRAISSLASRSLVTFGLFSMHGSRVPLQCPLQSSIYDYHSLQSCRTIFHYWLLFVYLHVFGLHLLHLVFACYWPTLWSFIVVSRSWHAPGISENSGRGFASHVKNLTCVICVWRNCRLSIASLSLLLFGDELLNDPGSPCVTVCILRYSDSSRLGRGAPLDVSGVAPSPSPPPPLPSFCLL